MIRSPFVQFDWPAWRADVVERLDRRAVGIALAFVTVCVPLSLLGPSDASAVALQALHRFGTLMVTLAVLAVALVAVARGISAWVAYPAAAFAAFAVGSTLGVVLDPFRWLAKTPSAPLDALIVAHLCNLAILSPLAVLYVYASSTTHDEKALRAVEAERVAEAERLAQQRLQTELATVDHDLVLRAMRLALAARAGETTQAEALLEAVTAYLRVAQQRGPSEPGRIAAALAELRRACANGGGEPARQAIA